MTALRVVASRLLDLLLRGRRDRRLDEEIDSHLQLLCEDYERLGMSPGPARAAALRSFGGVEQIRAEYRDQRGLPLLDAAVQDAAFAARLLRRDPAFAMTALFVLAVGIGVNNMLFTVLNAHTLRGLPIPASDRVAAISTTDFRNRSGGVSHPDFVDALRSSRSFDPIVALASVPVVIAGDGHSADRLDAAYLAGDAFALTGRQPRTGRAFSPEDQRVGAPLTAIITTDLWQKRYGEDPAVLDRSILLDGAPATIVGVVDQHSGLPTTAAIWIPLAHLPGLAAARRTDRSLRVFARLRDEVSFDSASAEVDAAMARLATEHPESNAQVRPVVSPIDEQFFGRWTDPVWFRFMTVGFLVLVISCANVANLMLARGIARAREMTIRTSLGASRGRLVRQLLIEGMLLAALGGTVGLGLGIAGVHVLRAAIPENALPYWYDYSLDGRVIGMLIAASLGTVLVFALVPAIQASRAGTSLLVKAGGRLGLGGRSARRWTTVFLVAEIALAVLLLAQAAVWLRNPTPGLPSDAAINSNDVLTASVTLTGARYASSGQRAEFYTRLRESLRDAGGIASMTVTTAPPFAPAAESTLIGVGKPFAVSAERLTVKTVAIAPGYFQTFALGIVQGRDLAETETMAGAVPAIVNQEFVRRFVPTAEAIGERIGIEAGGPESAPRWYTVVGIAPDVRQGRGSGREPVVYTPYLADPVPTATLLVRGHQGAALLIGQLREKVSALDPALPLDRVQTMADAIWAGQWNGRVSHRMFLTLTLIAAVLSMFGLYAVTMHGIRQRTNEIGVRIALGATPAHVIGAVVRQPALQLALGFFAGVACTRIWASGTPAGSDNAVSATDPQSLAIVAAILLLLAVSACISPVRRAMRLDPVAAIRHES